jgi:Fe-S-cluster containining protein
VVRFCLLFFEKGILIMDSVTCPNCEFELAKYMYFEATGEAHIYCIRCGYVEDRKRDCEKFKDTGKICWMITDKSGGKGCYTYRLKEGASEIYIVSCGDKPLNELPKHSLDTYEFFKCTYLRDGKWYIKDLINDVDIEYDPLLIYNPEDDDDLENSKENNEVRDFEDRPNKMDAQREESRIAELREIYDRFCDIFIKHQDCQRCGNCCHAHFLLPITSEDIEKEPRLLDLSRPIEPSDRQNENIKSQHIRIINLINDNSTCPLYQDGHGCSIYQNRPETCREYPPSLFNCLRAKLKRAGFSIQTYYNNDTVEAYCSTQLHHNTKLDCYKDEKTVYRYSLVMPFLFSAEKYLQFVEDQKNGKLLKNKYTFDDIIDLDQEIPGCVREYLQLDEDCKIIKDIFEPKRQAAIADKS